MEEVEQDLLYKERGLAQKKLEELQQLKDDPKALFKLGHCYFVGGLTLAIDTSKAKEHLRKSADLGYAPAMALLARLLKDDKDDSFVEYGKKALESEDNFACGLCCDFGLGCEVNEGKAFQYYLKACEEQERGLAMNNVGVCYANGDGVDQSDEQAYKWYVKASDEGVGLAKYNVATCYMEGDGVDQNVEEGVKWLVQASAEGIPDALVDLGWALMHGNGIEKDKEEAIAMFELSAKSKGFGEGPFALAYCWSIGKGVEESNMDKALEWYKQASECGHIGATYELAMLRKHGENPNEEEAFQLFMKLDAEDHPASLYNIAWAYQSGEGVEKDEKKSFEYYERAALLDHVSSVYALGWCYEHGTGVGKDLKKAIEWYEKADKLGDETAKSALKRLME